MPTTVIARQGDTLDSLCWETRGQTQGIVEEALTLNPGLADLGPVLPLGQRVIIPDARPAAPAPRINLWD